MSSKQRAPEVEVVEERIQWLHDRFSHSVKLREEKWKKLMLSEAAQNVMQDFFDSPDESNIFMYFDLKDELILGRHPPSSLKKKAVAFTKPKGTKVTPENINKLVAANDIAPAPLDQLSRTIHDVYAPLLANPKNLASCPQVVASDVLSHFHRFRAVTDVTVGLTKGQTLLPLPVATSSAAGSSSASSHASTSTSTSTTPDVDSDKAMLHALESAVVDWTHQIKTVLNTDSSAVMSSTSSGPLVELDFWASKASNLQSIFDQVSGDRIQKIVRILELTNSSYYPAFKRLFTDVETGLDEARNNHIYLSPLRPYLVELNQGDEFETFRKMFPELMSMIVLVWTHSKYYNTPSRLVILLKAIVNDIIEQGRNFVDATRVFKIEPPEAMERVSTAIKVCSFFKEAYLAAKTRVNAEGSKVAPWNFDNEPIFGRLNIFLARLQRIESLLNTMVEFNRLERVEVGGSRGKILSAQVSQIFDEFQEAANIFSAVEYDSLDPESNAFDHDEKVFSSTVADLERRIGSVLINGLDDCATVWSMFKIFESFDALLHRPRINKDAAAKFPALLQAYSKDLDAVQDIFRTCKDSPPHHSNMPNVSGTLSWSRGLKERISQPIEKLKGLAERSGGADFLQAEDAQEVFSRYEAMVSAIDAFDSQAHQSWSKDIGKESQAKLKQTILSRASDGSRLLSVNFDPALVALLREVKYFKLLDLSIPDSASTIYAAGETYRRQTAKLDIIVSQYNFIVKELLDIEGPLVKDRLDALDAQLERGLTHLNWNSDGVNDFIDKVSDTCSALYDRITSVKANVKAIRDIVAEWETPLLERRDPKKLIELESEKTRIAARQAEIQEQGKRIHELVEESRVTLGVSDASATAWITYVKSIDSIVLEGIVALVESSLSYLLRQMDSAAQDSHDDPVAPLIEAKLELVAPSLVFTPDMDGSSGGLQHMIDWCVEAFFNTATKLNCLTDSKADYSTEVRDVPKLKDLSGSLATAVTRTMDRARAMRDGYLAYSHLWTEDRDEYLASFLAGKLGPPQAIQMSAALVPPGSGSLSSRSSSSDLYAGRRTPVSPSRSTTPGGEEDDEDKPAKKNAEPELADFDAQITHYHTMRAAVADLPSVQTFGWIRVDAKPLKQALSTVIGKWAYMFTQHLHDRVVNGLADLKAFIAEVTAGLHREVAPGDYEGLVQAMSHLLAIRNRVETTDNMFEPLREMVSLIKKYGIAIPDEVYQDLDDVPEEWTNTKKLLFTARDRLSPLQAAEVRKIQDQEAAFSARVDQFRDEFSAKAPFTFSLGCEAAYTAIDEWHIKVLDVENQATAIAAEEELFELTVHSYKGIRDCRHDLVLLKHLWDMIAMVENQFVEWRKTLWNDIDVDFMDVELKKLVKEIRSLDRDVRAWNAYSGLDAFVKNLMTNLPLVADLRSPAMRERHWKQLAKATGVQFTIDESFRLEDLLALNLHSHLDEVASIVDRASKELQMEKTISTLDKTWASMAFEFGLHKESDLPILRPLEELIDVLEENQVLLQNMMVSKYVSHFHDSVNRWQQSLSLVDSVITTWLEVQRTWEHLENIFIGSEDIRKQLPQDSKRFDGIDAEWRELMYDAAKTPNVVEACSKDGLLANLEDLQARLSLCEKSLAEYLETKRLAFPRFYFSSAADLLDILAKGNSPVEVQVHLPKLFDNINKLEWKAAVGDKKADGTPVPEIDTKTAIGMYSKEGEYVAFTTPCECTGPVEIWLNRLVDTMRSTLRDIMEEAVYSYEEKPREQWLMDYPAQIALAVSLIWWSTEVNIAFERLEEGNETALKEYNKKQMEQLTKLIHLIQGKLDKNTRQKIMTLCTIDVHSRDVVTKMIRDKVENASAFAWQSQLRLRWDENENDCFINLADAQFQYSYEYLGNTMRLVITPLTDRCYVTLTQALRLILGGAPAGPAGTGKTETTKDLGRALGLMVYVVNCSEQMDYKSLGNIFKGLAQSGAWGCFDEFNRISIEVLSVVATQYKSILDAIRAKKTRFQFQGEEISLVPTCGAFITMNPGYAGRTELPSNLKALFRPVSMVVPDIELICEIMLMTEGFVDAKILAKKFTTLYALCKELLSKQDHYDWGLRAIRSVLVVAGGLKRAEPPEMEEADVLMRALRDFNLPKIVTDDVPVFMGLINDLFPKRELPRKRDLEKEKVIKEVVINHGLQPEDAFLLKIVQLEELLAVRHSVFIIGPPGSGKTEVWRMLAATNNKLGNKTTVVDLNPKAVTPDELYGFVSPATREWKDGLFSIIMRDLSNVPNQDPKWIVLDGDIDPGWIESLNTVMDDNKVLTLASNERIPLHPHMRLIFEIGHLKYATPATVSRAGILYLNETDVGWNPFVQSWIDRQRSLAGGNLVVLFDKYVPPCLDFLRKNVKTIVPVSDFSRVQTLCYLLEGLLNEVNIGTDKELYELYFVYAAIWAFGGSLHKDQLEDHRETFSKWFRTEWRQVRFPGQGSVYDYYVDPSAKKFVHWAERLEAVATHARETEAGNEPEPLPEIPGLGPIDTDSGSGLVATVEAARTANVIHLLAASSKPILLVGAAGVGKSTLVRSLLKNQADDTMAVTANFNFFTDSATLQTFLEAPLERKAGRNYAPPGTRKLIYFIDDLNMPEVDVYGTQSPATLLRQHLDYGHWYDRQKMTLKEVSRVQYIACMNPTAGSFHVNPRLQRHFAVLAVSFPSTNSLTSIYRTSLGRTMDPSNGWSSSMIKVGDKAIAATLDLHMKVAARFLPTATRFHYQFNMRDLKSVTSGLSSASPKTVKTSAAFARLWLHEVQRVYGDRLINAEDHEVLDELITDTMKKHFPDQIKDAMATQANIWCHFAQGLEGKVYAQVESYDVLKTLLTEALDQHNETNAAMNLVLFADAMHHVARIARILEAPAGNALLVGVGGSGKQSLARLAAHIVGYEVFQIVMTRTYKLSDLKADLQGLYMKAGVKGQGVVFLLTDSQIVDDKFLVYINDFLSTGEIGDLFAADEKENIIGAMRTEVKAAGQVDSRENCWAYFIEKVRAKLHMVLCFSPVGDSFRLRARMFPGLVNCTTVDWFHPWPKEALLSVAKQFLADEDLGEAENMAKVTSFMAFAHDAVNKASSQYYEEQRRYYYTTPKSFLELINFYKLLLAKKRKEIEFNIERMRGGLDKLKSTAEDVAKLQLQLEEQGVTVKERKVAADALLAQVTHDTNIVNEERAFASKEEKKSEEVAARVRENQKECETELSAALPAIERAEAALNTLNKGNLSELKGFASPTKEVENVLAAVMILLSPPKGVRKDLSWAAARKTMVQLDRFLEQLLRFDKENIPPANLEALRPYLAQPSFTPEIIKAKSVAASGLCSWVVNIVKYYEIYCDVQPKRDALAAANADLEASQAKVSQIKAKVAHLDSRLRQLTNEFEKAMEEKNKAERQEEKTKTRLDLAERLVVGLGSERDRWEESIHAFKASKKTLVGDVLLASCFVSYAGGFDRTFRDRLVRVQWMGYLKELALPMSEDVDPMSVLADEADIAGWSNDGLPTDRVSVENAAIFTNCERSPLIIDPQLQGITWIKAREAANVLHVIRLNSSNYLDVLERAITAGEAVLIENIGEEIDPILEPVVSRNVVRKARNLYVVKLGDKEVEWDSNFRLFLQTKLSNPHYRPEIQAQTTLINFTVTEDGLEDQLLALVVNKERPDLEEQKATLMREQNGFKIKLKELEDSLLEKLTAAEGDLLGDTELIENLERTKATVAEIQEKVAESLVTEVSINQAREQYRPVAARSSMLYFLLNDLPKVHIMYQYSLNAFVTVFAKAMDRAEAAEEVQDRVKNLIDSITFTVFAYASRGLFERHKLILSAQLCFQILARDSKSEFNAQEFEYLIRGTKVWGDSNPAHSFLSDSSWAAVVALKDLPAFANLPSEIESTLRQWKKWCDHEKPEEERLPSEWKSKTDLQKLCMIRALRPDRLTYAVRNFVQAKLGSRFVEALPYNLEAAYEETSPEVPVFFFLSPGVDPVKDVEALGRKLGFNEEAGKFWSVSLGQGQEPVAEAALEAGASKGGWVMLQNIHLTKQWLPQLEKKLEALAVGAHEDFRVFLTAEASSNERVATVPAGILQNCVKLANEPPQGIKSNMLRAMGNVSQETLEMCSKENEFKTVLFVLVFFHAIVLERRKFGPQGWNKNYPFNSGDLTISVDVLYNYLESNPKIPWEDLRYIFGEIMYGGHISDDWDRRLCSTYLASWMRDDLFEDLELAPDFLPPQPTDYKGYLSYIQEYLPAESPHLFGMHPNAEITSLTQQSEELFRVILGLQPRTVMGAGGVSRDEKVGAMIEDFLERLPDNVDLGGFQNGEERSPYVSVCLQECVRMNGLLSEIRRSLKELSLGLRGDLTMTGPMEELIQALFNNEVPGRWSRVAYPSLRPLDSWFRDLLKRWTQLDTWSGEQQLPNVVWLPGLFNPQAFLTAVIQTTARKNKWPLDKMALQTDVTKKTVADVQGAPREGAYVSGLYLEGARWDTGAGALRDSHLKELYSTVPVVYVKAVTVDKLDSNGIYECPLYATPLRGPHFVTTFRLRTTHPASKWILAGVALLLEADR